MRAPSIVTRTASALSSIASSLATYFWNSFYPSLDPSRKEVFNGWRPRGGTVNQVTPGSFTGLSAQCRHLERSTPWGRAVSEALSAECVGSGIGILPNTGDDARDAKLYDGFERWAEHAMVDGSSLWLWQALIPRELATSGNALARVVILPERVQKGWLPVALLPLEAEWLAEYPVAPIPDGYRFIRGVVIDKICRPAFYHLRNPETMLTGQGEVVPAEQIIHIFERRRPQQVIGEPILAPVVERILQDARLIETELKAANATAAPAVAITTQSSEGAGTDQDEAAQPITDIPAGATVRLYPGESVQTIENKRPSQQIAPFRATIRGDIAAACRISQFSLDRDPSRANYSSMRLDQLFTKRTLAALKETIGVGAAARPYESAVPWLMLDAGYAMPDSAAEKAKLNNCFLRPDQPEYVDPVKDVQASVNAIANNLSTYDIELSARGKNWRAVFKQRAIENALLAQHGLPLPHPQKSAAPEHDEANEDADDIDADSKQKEEAA
ncbi:MAG TPA: phage portal protein [Planctomycetota bacterium]|nr:phage portal protein [Planctomycetota bacterium]